jgi:hypothetical protein
MSSGRRGRVDEYVVISGGAGDPKYIAGTVDPSAGGGVPAPEGSIFSRFVAAAGEFWLKTGAADTAWSQIMAGLSGREALFGSGSDGATSIAAPTTLTEDLNATTLSVTSSLDAAGFRIYATESITISAAGSIENDGDGPIGDVGGLGGLGGTLGAGAAGGDRDKDGDPILAGGLGGAGGDGGGTRIGGAVTAPIPEQGVADWPTFAAMGHIIGAGAGGSKVLQPLFGGGGGAGGNGGSGGAGGGGGGLIVLASPLISNAGAISCDGGDGTAASGGNDDGGGGGGGGAVLRVFLEATGAGTLTVAGGALGAGDGSGGAGVAGSVGTIVDVDLS